MARAPRTPEQKTRRNEVNRERYAADPVWRAKVSAASMADAKRAYHEDPERRARVQAYCVGQQRRRRASADGWQLSQIRKVRHRAAERGLPFDLRPEDIPVPAVCPVLGIPITLGAGPKAPGLPSIDRKKPELGYVRGNVAVISWRANHLKNDCISADELEAVARYIRANEG